MRQQGDKGVGAKPVNLIDVESSQCPIKEAYGGGETRKFGFLGEEALGR